MANQGLFTVRTRRLVACIQLVAFVFGPSGFAFAQTRATDIAQTPLLTSESEKAKPNAMFIMDDSGSMNWEFMPGEPSDATDLRWRHIGSFSPACNKLYWDGSDRALPPDPRRVKAGDTSTHFDTLPEPASNDIAWVDGYGAFQSPANSATVNIASNFPFMGKRYSRPFWIQWNDVTPPTLAQCQAELPLADDGSGNLKIASGALGSDGRIGSTKFYLSYIDSSDMRSFNIWYSYYRTRLHVLKAAAAFAFASPGLDGRVRFGFVTTNPMKNGSVDAGRFLAPQLLGTGSGTTPSQADLIKKLYAQRPEDTAGTPLHEALSRVGLYYANQASGIAAGMTPDPVQYACQRNTAFMITDGYWNGSTPASIGSQPITARLDSGPPASGRYPSSDPQAAIAAGQVPYPMNDRFQMEADRYRVNADVWGDVQANFAPVRPSYHFDGRPLQSTPPASTSDLCTEALPGGATVTLTRPEIRDASGTVVSPAQAMQFPRYVEYWSVVSETLRWDWHPMGYPDSVRWSNSRSESTLTSALTPSEINEARTEARARKNTLIGNYAVDETDAARGVIRVDSAEPVKRVGGLDVYDIFFGGAGAVVKDPAYRDITTLMRDLDPSALPSNTINRHPKASSGARPKAWFVGCARLAYSGWVPATDGRSMELNGGATPSGAVGSEYRTVACAPDAVGVVPACASAATKTDYIAANGTSHSLAKQSPWKDATGNEWLSPSGITLADVAMYFAQKVDLRPNMADQVPPRRDDGIWDPYKRQHMQTFTMGIGVQGLLPTDDTTITPPGGASWLDALGTVPGMGWVSPTDFYAPAAAKIDDLWHAAINGLGQYFNASDPREIQRQLELAINAITSTPAAGASVGVANLDLTADSGNGNVVYSTGFTSGSWTGNVFRREFDPATLGFKPQQRDAMTELSTDVQRSCDRRKLHVFRGATSIGLFWPASVAGQAAVPQYAAGVVPAAGGWAGWPTLPSVSGSQTLDLNAIVNGGSTNRAEECAPFSGSERMRQPSNSEAGLSAYERAMLNPWLAPGLSGETVTPYPNNTARNVGARRSSDLVNYLRGQFGAETRSPNLTQSRWMRPRASNGVPLPLGGIVSSKAVFVEKPFFDYTENNYGDFKSTLATRRGMVYVGANDGMLHAFDGESMREEWAAAPSYLVPDLWRLSTARYSSQHRFFLDGTPVIGDVFDAVQKKWRTILVIGMNAGGSGFMAVDVTEPKNPKPLWELSGKRPETALKWPGGRTVDFGACQRDRDVTDEDVSGERIYVNCKLGLAYGNPVITKVNTSMGQRWVVMVASGYNNPDKKGYLLVRDAITGELIRALTVDPAQHGDNANRVPDRKEVGLAKLATYAENGMLDNLTTLGYAGDLVGNLWRFDFRDSNPQQWKVNPLGKLDPGQSVTTRPELGAVGGKPIVFVGTGRYLGESDIIDSDSELESIGTQSFWAIVDDATSTTRTRADLRQLAYQGNDVRVVSGAADKGWVLDMPRRGERIFVEPTLQLGALAFVSNVPSTDACQPGGTAWLTVLDFASGRALASDDSGQRARMLLGNALGTGLQLVRTADGKLTAFTQLHNGEIDKRPINVVTGGKAGRRVTWKELIP